jgi:hypothetical protein
LCIDTRRDCGLLVSNDNRAEAICATLVDQLVGPVELPGGIGGLRAFRPKVTGKTRQEPKLDHLQEHEIGGRI